MNLKGRTAIVTGASGGIGRAISMSLANQGVNQLITARSKGKLNQLESELNDLGVKACAYPCDLTDVETPGKIVTEAIECFGQLDILINNAGIADASPLEETSTEQWDTHMALNARAPFVLCREALKHLRASDAAVIINIASVVAHKGYENQGAYTASKHALLGFTKVLAQEVFNDGIRVHIISPGGVETDMVTKTRPDLDSSILISPQEIADIVVFLLKSQGKAAIDEINIRRSSKPPWK